MFPTTVLGTIVPLLPLLALVDARGNTPLQRSAVYRHLGHDDHAGHTHVFSGRDKHGSRHLGDTSAHDRRVAKAGLDARHIGSVEGKMAKRAHGRKLASRAGTSGQALDLCRSISDGTTTIVTRSGSVTSTYSIVASSTTSSVTASSSAVTWSSAAPATSLSSSSSNWNDNEAYAAATATSTASTTASATASASSSSSSSSGSTSTYYTPNGIKAGLSAGDAYSYLEDHIGWWYDWTPAPSGHSGTPIAVSMLWGAGTADATDAERYAEFEAMTSNPTWIIGFEEPDCSAGSGSSGIDESTAASVWNNLMVPHGEAGSLLLSPSMCHQAAETYLTPFSALISRPWDITNVHINKNSVAGIELDLDYYWNTYGRPIWVTEFACVDDSTGFVPCTDQDEINTFINDAVALFESDSRVYAYAYSNGAGLGDVWPMINSAGDFSESGQTYLTAISAYH